MAGLLSTKKGKNHLEQKKSLGPVGVLGWTYSGAMTSYSLGAERLKQKHMLERVFTHMYTGVVCLLQNVLYSTLSVGNTRVWIGFEVKTTATQWHRTCPISGLEKKEEKKKEDNFLADFLPPRWLQYSTEKSNQSS